MKRALVVPLLALSLSLMAAPAVLAMSGMPMPAAPAGPAPVKLDAASAQKLVGAALDGLNLTEDQMMKVHDFLHDYVTPMDELMGVIDKSAGSEKDLKEQEMMLLMEKAQVQVDSVLDDAQAQLFDALVFGSFPDAKGAPADQAAAARLKAAADLRAAVDDHAVTKLVIDHLANLMPAMPGMDMSH